MCLVVSCVDGYHVRFCYSDSRVVCRRVGFSTEVMNVVPFAVPAASQTILPKLRRNVGAQFDRLVLSWVFFSFLVGSTCGCANTRARTLFVFQVERIAVCGVVVVVLVAVVAAAAV